MRDIDKGGGQALVQLDDLGAHAGTQLGVQVGQRLVEQEDGRVAHHGAAQRNTLALAAGQSLRLAVQQVLDLEDLGGFVHAAVDLVLRGLAQLEAERHVLVHGHVRIQRVVLEHHGDVAVLRGNVVHQLVADVQLALGDLLQAGDHAQRGGLAAAGGADEDDEFLIGDLQVEIGHSRSRGARIHFVDVFAADGCHNKTSCMVGPFVLDGFSFDCYDDTRKQCDMK
jgi:hypothetical protein